jgi:hypothetical protein
VLVVVVVVAGAVWVVCVVLVVGPVVGVLAGTGTPPEEGLLPEEPHAARRTTQVSATIAARGRMSVSFLISRQ